MRIGLDARILGHPTSGIGVYVVNLVKEFLKYPDLEVILFGDRSIYGEYKHITDRVEVVIFGQAHRRRWSQVYLPSQLRKFDIDIYHATWNNAVPVFTSCPSVLTVHDIIPLVVDGYFKNLRRRLKYILSMKSALMRARVILSDAESTKRDLVKFFNIAEDKIKAIYLGCEDRSPKPNPSGDIFRKFGLDGDYIINIGSFDPRRNAQTLIKAFGEFVNKSAAKTCLVLTGGYDNFPNQVRQLKSLADSLGLHGKVIFTGHVAQSQMAALVLNAKLMVHTSLYEGFGLPVLEAMNYGVPVIASNTGSIPEVAGEAALSVNPMDIHQIATAIEKVWASSSLSDGLVKKGYARLKDFSWEKTAKQTLDAYRSVCPPSLRTPHPLPLPKGERGSNRRYPSPQGGEGWGEGAKST